MRVQKVKGRKKQRERLQSRRTRAYSWTDVPKKEGGHRVQSVEEELDTAEDRRDGGGRVRGRGCGRVRGWGWVDSGLVVGSLHAVCHSFQVDALPLVAVVM